QVSLAPGIEHEERPENLRVILHPIEMFSHQPRCGLGIEETETVHSRWCQALLQRAPQRTAQPQTNRDAKPLLPAGEDRFWKEVAKGALQDVLGLPPSQLELGWDDLPSRQGPDRDGDRKSTRLNSSHVSSSYAVFCLKKKRR